MSFDGTDRLVERSQIQLLDVVPHDANGMLLREELVQREAAHFHLLPVSAADARSAGKGGRFRCRAVLGDQLKKPRGSSRGRRGRVHTQVLRKMPT